ncbi:MAG: hypothetical protein NTY77_07290 [Elusimicrobia bacterium]|nr:hypothetical protein [Elusimicrobiota bacterium]
MKPGIRDVCMMFSGGVDTTLAAAHLLEEDASVRLHLLTFCNGYCVKVGASKTHVVELQEKYGADRLAHRIIYVSEIFERLRRPLPELIRKYGSTLVIDLCCRLSFETAAVIYCLNNGIREVCDGTNIDQGVLFLERPDYLRVIREFFASQGIEYFSPVYARSGGRLGRRQEMLKRGFSIGPRFLERLNITSSLFRQPFCLIGIHTFFFTSFLRRLPLLKNVIERCNLPVDRAIACRLERQAIAREIIRENVKPSQGAESVKIQERICTTRLCGQSAVEISLPFGTRIDLERLASSWQGQGAITRDGGLLSLSVPGAEVRVLVSGRVEIHGTKDQAQAIALYQRYVAGYDVFLPPQ